MEHHTRLELHRQNEGADLKPQRFYTHHKRTGELDFNVKKFPASHTLKIYPQ